MKKYTINLNYYASATIEVLAETEDEARQKMRSVIIEKEDIELEPTGHDFVEEEDMPDLSELIKKAEKKLIAADKMGVSFQLSPWPTITTVAWDGVWMRPTRTIMSAVYYDEEREEIGFEGENGAAELTISDLPEIEQYNLAQSIISAAKRNGERFNVKL